MTVSKIEEDVQNYNDFYLKNTKLSILGARHFQSLLLFFCITIEFIIRSNVSIALVEMIGNKPSNSNYETFDWYAGSKEIILSSFFWGFIITQIPGGLIAHRYGPKWPIFFAILISSLIHVFLPLIVRFGGWKLMCALRIGQGLSQGLTFPAVHTFISKWVPIEERAKLSPFIYSGVELGTVLAFATSGITIESLGWPGIFYMPGIIGLIVSALWAIFGSGTPAACKYISIDEQEYIETSLKNVVNNDTHRSTPWLKILTSIPFLATVFAQGTQSWGFWILQTELPSYMKYVLDRDIIDNGLMTAFPYFVMWIMTYVFVGIASILAKYKVIRTIVSRKLFFTIGTFLPALFINCFAFITKEHVLLAIIFLTLAIGVNGAAALGPILTYVDLAPNFAGTLFAISGVVGSGAGMIAPLTVHAIVKDNTDQMQWQIIFYIGAAIYLLGNLSYVIFAECEPQKWNDEVDRETTKL